MDNERILKVSHKLCTGKNCVNEYPDKANISVLINELHKALFPELFSQKKKLQELLKSCFEDSRREIQRAMCATCPKTVCSHDDGKSAKDIATELIESLPQIQQQLYKDAKAAFDGDPAAKSVEEVILTYPGFFAVMVHRIAHFLFAEGVRLIPRMMSEYAHSKTGIDIHPGATIGEYFFIDHGTGVVIGETTVIGNFVKIFQGVTLGALSTRQGQKLAGKKRHPTIEDNVTIYSGASILGGETVIGANSTIGGNAFITKSVPKDSKITI